VRATIIHALTFNIYAQGEQDSPYMLFFPSSLRKDAHEKELYSCSLLMLWPSLCRHIQIETLAVSFEVAEHDAQHLCNTL
jgi:hypothetical protein